MPSKSLFELNGFDILVVDDDHAASMINEKILAHHGAQVQTAHSGTQALKLFAERHFPVVITDICMPDMDGIELAAQLRQMDGKVQIIAATAVYDTERLISAIQLGFNDYILKPVESSKLLWAVKRCLDLAVSRSRLEEEQIKFHTVVDCLGEGISIKDLDFKILYQNRTVTELFGDRINSTCYSVFGLDNPCPDCATVLAIKDGQPHTSCRIYRNNGKPHHIECTASLLRNSQGVPTGSVEIIRDISERINNELTIRDMAFHDPLTGLANRRLFEDRLAQAIANARRSGSQFGLIYLDLDNFKAINDSYGHEAGDLVLVETAMRIKACCKRDLDTISRLGGDEFCIIFTDCGDRKQLTAIVEELLDQFALPFHLPHGEIRVTTSIGISIFPDNGSVIKELEIASDRAMYAAKKAGRNTYRFWEPYPNPVTVSQ